jgi:hypothetical protein
MAFQPGLHTIEGLAVELDRDRRTIAKALRATPADGEISGRSAWRVATAVAALRAREGTANIMPALDECARLAEEIEELWTAMEALPNLPDRRRLVVERGRLIGELERALAASIEGVPEAEAGLHRLFHEHVMAATISQVLVLAGWTVREDKAATRTS